MSSTRHYYNDVDPVACEWTRELIRDGLIPDGDVDCRSICEVQADEIRGYTQWHFFVGISGWPLALRLAGVDPARPLLSGSCPCQPFSSAGKRKGTDDERHLWPELLRLISELRPAIALGEQVASRLGREWLARVRTDLEALGYAVGASDLPAGGVGAPHKRQRLFWGAALRGRGTEPVAEPGGAGVRAQGYRRADGATGEDQGAGDQRQRVRVDAGDGIAPVAVADASSNGLDLEQGEFGGEEGARERRGEPANDGGTVTVADVQGERTRSGDDQREEGGCSRELLARTGAWLDGGNHRNPGPWSDYDIILCGDGKHRRIPKGSAQLCVQSLADGLPDGVAGGGLPCLHSYPLAPTYPGRVALLKGIGNAISPQVGAVFVRAFFEAVEDQNG